MPEQLSHIDDRGAARMVDVSDKAVTARTASASGRVLVSCFAAPENPMATRWRWPGWPGSWEPSRPPR